jgi:dethiobiotin synthetase
VRHGQTPRIIFITGTDTSVGKTVLSALLLSHLRQTGSRALAIKPFCSGGRADAELLHDVQHHDLSLDQINPFYFSKSVAPLVAAREQDQRVPIVQVLRDISSVVSCLSAIENRKSKIENPILLIEGAGGLLAPLGEPHSGFKAQGSKFKVQSSNYYTALDLILAFNCRVILVAPNRLGTINHTLLTVQALHCRNIRKISIVLMDLNSSSSRITHPSSVALLAKEDHASRSNPSILAELLSPIPLFRIPNLGKNPSKPEQIHKFAKKVKKTLAEILA